MTFWLLLGCVYVSGVVGFWPEVKIAWRDILNAWRRLL